MSKNSKENKKQEIPTKEPKENQNIKVEENIENKDNKTEENEKTKKSKIRRRIVIAVFILALIIAYIIERGDYLEIKEIGENYISIFWQNMQYISITAIVNFLVVFTIMYTTTSRVKQGLKTFFDDEKKTMPKLPQKSIAFIVAILVTIFTSGMILEKALPCFYNTQFVATDPVFGLDIGYFVFIWPFLELILMYILIAIIGSTIYAAIYYLIVFNMYFDGISRDSVKKSKILSQVLANIKVLAIVFAIFVLLETQNIGVQKFLILNNDESENYSLFGAGITETTIRLWGYVLLSVIIIFTVFKAISEFKKGNTKKVIKSILIVPGYLVLLFVVMIGFNLIFVNSNELDKEKQYIETNIKNTKIAYGINIDETLINDAGTITREDITNNTDTITNIPIVSKNTVLQDLEGSQTSKGYYNYPSTQVGVYEIDNKQQLVYVTPREISASNGTYNNKTYEYTHGFGVILSSATSTTDLGNVNHFQKSFEQTDEVINISKIF